MRYLLVDDSATTEELREAITHLRRRQRCACIPSTAAEIGADIDELLDLLVERGNGQGQVPHARVPG
jgi:hypothetical protein